MPWYQIPMVMRILPYAQLLAALGVLFGVVVFY
jgi:hypothetical protein